MKHAGHIAWSWAVACALALGGCATSLNQAPVVERQATTSKTAPPAPKTAPPISKAKEKPKDKEKDWRPETYTVKKGDTLYSIGLEHGYDYKEIARHNAIDPPYLIRVGQQLRLKGESAAAVATEGGAEAVVTPLQEEATAAPKPLKEDVAPAAKETRSPAIQPAKAEDKPQAKPENVTLSPDEDTLEWSWPTQGKIIAGNDAVSAKGVDIGGQQGQPVTAAAPGKVVYSGSGLRGYGKLVIIKHNKTYLSAYAHNSQLLVKEGQEVARGQKIAEMGSSDTDRVKLHFEIRRLGKPVDPAKYLSAQ